jgi:hypothetical protein
VMILKLPRQTQVPVTKVPVTGVQTCTFETDWLGRTTAVTQPESSTTTYSYGYSNTSGLDSERGQTE